MAAYTTIDNPELYFQAKTYTGNSNSSHAITFDNTDTSMQPDLVWIKNRNNAEDNVIFDSVRGGTKRLYTNGTHAEGTDNAINSFDSNGFNLNTASSLNYNTYTYVAWCWKAGTAFSNDASATSVGSIDSSGSKNTTSGFSIVSYTGNGTANQSVAHGLGATPQFIIIKNRSTSGYWPVTNPRFVSVSDPNMVYLQVNAAEADDTNINGTTAPSSTVFGVDDYGAVNTSGDNHIAYCFAEKQGYSSFKSYTGSGNADGPFIYTGFRPAFLIIKCVGALGNWLVFDSKRSTFNQIDGDYLEADANSAEVTTSSAVDLDFLSNGFKMRNTSDAINKSGTKYIYMAFAEAPFVNSNGVPCNAR